MRTRATSKATSALQQALKWLERREYFAEELRAKLTQAGWPEDEVSQAVDYVKSKRLLSDERALESTLTSRSGKRAIGRARLTEELEAKGASAEALASVIPDDQAEIARALELLSLKYRGGLDVSRAARFLASRGFEEEIIASVIDRLGAE